MKGPNLSEWALAHRSLVVYLMLLCLGAGLWAYSALGRNEDPPFTIKTMLVQTLWPGATTRETIDEVTDKIEKQLQQLPDLDNLESYTSPGKSLIYVTLKESTPKHRIPELWYQVRKKTGDIHDNLPAGIQGPFFNDEYGATFGIIYGFTGDGYSLPQLRDYVEGVRDQLLALPNTGEIDLIGVQDEQITLGFDPRRLANLGISEEEIIAALQAQNRVEPAGRIAGRNQNILVHVSGAFHDARDLASLGFFADHHFLNLSQVATVTRGPVDPPEPEFRVNGHPAIGLAISMARGGNVLQLGNEIRARMAELADDRPIGIHCTLVADQPRVVRGAIHRFISTLLDALAIVLLASFLSLGLRAGAVVALSIPLVLGITFAGMKLMGIDLQRVSLGALIIALGLLVDDAMITVEMMIRQIERGRSLYQAATFAYASTAFPMLTGTIVTVLGFVPVGFAASSAGEYTVSLFYVLAIALGASWIVAVVFSPLIGVTILRPAMKPNHDRRLSHALNGLFRRSLLLALRHRHATIGLAGGLFILALLGSGAMQHRFFPNSDRPELLVDIQLPEDASIYATRRAVERAEKRIAADKDIAQYSFYVGQGAIRFYLPMNVEPAEDFYAEGVIVARSVAVRDAVARRMRAQLTEALPDALVRVSSLELGPPVGWPIQYRVSGPGIQTLRTDALNLARTLGTDPAIRRINFEWNEPERVVDVSVNQDEARLLGLSSQQLAQAIDQLFSGRVVSQLGPIDIQGFRRGASL